MCVLIASDPDTRLFKVREAFKITLLLRFRAYIRAYIYHNFSSSIEKNVFINSF